MASQISYQLKFCFCVCLLLSSTSIISAQTRTAPIWINFKLGEKSDIPKPWNAIIVEKSINGININCWNRSYKFSQTTPFPVQITSSAQDILANPMNILFFCKRKMLSIKSSGKIKINSTSDHSKIEFSQNAISENGIELSLHYSLEFDGLLVCDINISNKNDVDIDSIKVDIPIKNTIGIYEQRYRNNQDGITWKNGKLSSLPGIIDNSNFVPYIWIGNDLIGLFWFCESPINWTGWQHNSAIQLIRDKNKNLTLRLNLLDKSNNKKNIKYTFGIQATPVKPFLKDWRRWRLSPAKNANIAIAWPSPKSYSTKYFGYPQAINSFSFDSIIARYHSRQQRFVPYFCATAISTRSPEWKKYKSQWNINYELGTNDTNRYNKEFIARTDPTNLSFQNFIVYRFYNFIKKFQIDGFYLDLSNVIDINDRKGVKEKEKIPFFPILSIREIYKRLYIISKEINPDFITIGHTSKNLYLPVLSFVDAYVDGEQFGSNRYKVKDSYEDVLSLDQFRSEFMGKQFGIIPIFLPKFDKSVSQLVPPTRELMGLLLIHDVLPWAQWCNYNQVNEMYDIIDQFDIINSKFIPYYDENPVAIATNMPHVYISAYSNPDAILLIAANLSKSEERGIIRINPRYIISPSYKLIELNSGKALIQKSNQFIISLPSQSYKIIKISF